MAFEDIGYINLVPLMKSYLFVTNNLKKLVNSSPLTVLSASSIAIISPSAFSNPVYIFSDLQIP